MITYMVTVRGTDCGIERDLIFLVEGRNEEDALGQACDLQRVRCLDAVESVTCITL